MHYVNFVVVQSCKIFEVFYCPSQSFVCHHEKVIKDLKVLNIKILKIQKMVIAVLDKLQKSRFYKILTSPCGVGFSNSTFPTFLGKSKIVPSVLGSPKILILPTPLTVVNQMSHCCHQNLQCHHRNHQCFQLYPTLTNKVLQTI
jgi:hypothetical protein